MIKKHKYLLAFSSTLLLALAGSFVVSYKYFTILIHHGLYYCQEMAKTLNLYAPQYAAKSITALLLLIAGITAIKFFKLVMSVIHLKKDLIRTTIRPSRTVVDLLRRLHVEDDVRIYTNTIPRAFCFGVRNPKIYLSTGLIDLVTLRELEIVLRHEHHHMKYKDTMTLFVATLLESLFPIFPMVSDMITSYRIDRELQADKAAILNPEDIFSLKEVLRKLIVYEPKSQLSFLPAIMSIDTLEARINALNSAETAHTVVTVRNVIISLISLFIGVGLIVTPVNAIELHANGQDVVMLCDKSSSCESVCRQQTLNQLNNAKSSFSPVSSYPFSPAY